MHRRPWRRFLADLASPSGYTHLPSRCMARILLTAALHKASGKGAARMQIGMIGLGRMGANIVRRLMRGGHACVVYDRDPAPAAELAAEGALARASPAELVAALAAPRVVWIMLPAGSATEQAITELSGLLQGGDCLIDGGNSFWKDDIRRARSLQQKGLHYLDVGTSGGVWGDRKTT